MRAEIGRNLIYVEVSYSLQRSVEALYELYELSGVKVENAYYTLTWYGDFCFGTTEESVMEDRTFFSRSFGFEETIPGIFFTTQASRPDSPVHKLSAPEKADALRKVCGVFP